MLRLLTLSLGCGLFIYSITGGQAWAAPFELKVQKVKIDVDGMLVDHLYFPNGKNVVRFVQSPTWTMINGDNSITIKDSKVPSGNIEVTFRGAFVAKELKELESEIVSDAIGDLYAEGNPEVKFEEVKLRNQPQYLGYSVVLTHKKYGKETTRGVLYFKLSDEDVLKIRIGVPPEDIEASLKAAKRWVNSFQFDTQERLDRMVREGFKP